MKQTAQQKDVTISAAGYFGRSQCPSRSLVPIYTRPWLVPSRDTFEMNFLSYLLRLKPADKSQPANMARIAA